MGVRQIRYCDMCHSDSSVDTFRWGYGKITKEVDLCYDCYSHTVKEVDGLAKRASKGTVRPQHRFEVTSVSRKNL